MRWIRRRNIRRYFHDQDDPASLESNDVKSSGEDREADSGLPPARASIHSIEELAKLRCIYRCMKFRTHSLSTKIASECSGSIMFQAIHWPYLTGRHTLSLNFSFHEENSPGPALTGITGMLEDQNGALCWQRTVRGCLNLTGNIGDSFRYRNSLTDPESLAQNSVAKCSQIRRGSFG